MNRSSSSQDVRLAEVIAALSLATDLATAQPLEHGLRRTLLAVWMGQELGLSEAELSTAYYVALLGSVGCILDGAALSEFVKDEIAVRGEMVMLDPSKQLQVAAFFFGHAGRGDPPLRRLRKFFSMSQQSHNVCRDVALHVGGLLDLGPEIKGALGQCDEHWNGKGPTLGLKGEEIHFAARLFILCHDVEVYSRVGGVDAAMSVIRERSGVVYDPRIVARFIEIGPSLLARLQTETAWDAVMAAEPAPPRMLSAAQFDEVAHRVANFVDMRSSYTVGHSPAVALLAEGAARSLGLPEGEAVALRQAGLLHDLGRAGVAASAWSKKVALSAEEWERMKRHPSLTELVLARSEALGHLGLLAGLHHERLDGSGYRGVSAGSLPVNARILAVADAYQSSLEPRPHREAFAPEQAADKLWRLGASGSLDADAVEAVLVAAGQPLPVVKRALPAGLSEREAEVLGLAVRGLSNRQIAEALVVSPKTVGHHMESIYSKIGVSTRVGATLFALQNHLIDGSTPV